MSYSNIDPNAIEVVKPIIRAMRAYHQHEVIGLDHLEDVKGGMLVFNHSLATYDIAMFAYAVWEKYQRIPRGLMDDLFYKVPYLGELMESLGAIEGTIENAVEYLKKNELVAVAPGGMREALRPSSERYQIRWETRRGFVKASIQSQKPIILAMCPKADDLFDVYPNPLTKWGYKTFKVPLFLATGVGLSPVPKPAKLIHFVSEPIKPPRKKADPEEFEAQVDKFHAKLVKRARELIQTAIEYRSHMIT